MKVTSCKCEECLHNENFNCLAEGIEVSSVGDKIVNTSDGTCCNTFQSRK